MKSLALLAFISLCLNIGSSNSQFGFSGSKGAGALSGAELRVKTPLSVIQEFTRNYPDVVHKIVVDMVNLIPDIAERERQRENLEQALIDTMVIEGRPCTTCKAVIQVLRVLLTVNDYAWLERNIIEACELLFTAIDQTNNAKETCNTVYYQGPHVAEVVNTMNSLNPLNTSTVDDICMTLNACYEIPEHVLMEPHGENQRIDPAITESDRKRDASNQKERQRAELRIVQITDVHLELGYAVDTNEDCPLLVCCLEKHGPGNAKSYGSYECNVPVRTLDLFLDKVVSLAPNMIIFSGDVPPHRVWDETLDSQLSCTRTLTERLREKLSASSNINVYPSIGNHEMYPTNLFSTRHIPEFTVTMVDSFNEMWGDLANFTDYQVATMIAGGYYTILTQYSDIRILSINTDYMYSLNFYNVLNHKLNRTSPPAYQYEATVMQQEVEAILSRAKEAGEKVILINHHPPGGGDYIIHASRWYESLVVNYSDIIILQVAGHTHNDEFRLIKDADNIVRSMVYVNPSIDMHGMTNPSIRLYTIDDATYEVTNYEQYYFDLSQLANEPPEITLLYNAKDAYQLPDLSPASWENLLKRFETDQELLLRHRRFSDADAGTPPSSCDESCRRNHVCRQLHANLDHYEVCAAGSAQETTTASTTITTTTWPPLIRPDSSTSPPVSSASRTTPGVITLLVSLLLLVKHFTYNVFKQ